MLSTLIPLLFVIVIIILFLAGLLFWGLKRTKNPKVNTPWLDTGNDLQIWLLVVAAFVTGIFIAYLLFATPIGAR